MTHFRDRLAPTLQGSVYVLSGLWPIVHLRSFERITGPKPEDWLVKTVGGLIAVVGAVMLVDGLRRRPSRELRLLGLGTAAVFATIDVIYASRGRISKVYLADAALHVAIASAWLAVRSTR